MFEQLTVTRNADDTYRLVIKGLNHKEEYGDFTIPKLRDFPIEIYQDPEEEIMIRQWNPFAADYRRNFRFRVETRIIPVENNKLYEFNLKSKTRRIRSTR